MAVYVTPRDLAALVVVEFPDRETARRWRSLPEYAAAPLHRGQGVERDLVPVEGILDLA